MTPNLNLLGLEIPREGWGFYTVLAVHIPAGLAATAAGAIAALSVKGGARHVRFGRLYFWAICVVFATAAVLASMRWREDYYLLVIGGVALAAACVGRLSRDRHRLGQAPHVLGMSISYVSMLAAFYVDNGAQLPVWNRLPHAFYWLLPVVVGVPITWRALRRARRL